eukprot:1394877-Amorphochlora_amoeboformis.AAC.1
MLTFYRFGGHVCAAEGSNFGVIVYTSQTDLRFRSPRQTPRHLARPPGRPRMEKTCHGEGSDTSTRVGIGNTAACES